MTELKKLESQLDMALRELQDLNIDENELLHDYIFDAHRLVKKLTIPFVSSSYVYIITLYDYDHDVIKHTFTDEESAINKHKELQENRTWGYYNLHKKIIE